MRNWRFISGLTLGSLLAGCNTAPPTSASGPDIRSQPPIIYLADNLGEDENLGWCIDTQGRGYSSNLHAHSCKPQSIDAQDGDINFQYVPQDKQIASAGFPDNCMAQQNGPTPFGLVACDLGDPTQQFVYVVNTGEFHPADTPEMCLSVGTDIYPAGPFQSRSLILAKCSSIDNAYKQWRILSD